jgi:hypothetical protein
MVPADYIQSGLDNGYFVVVIYSVMVIRILGYMENVQAHTHAGPTYTIFPT